MSSIDLAILGMVLEKPQSAYDIQKDVEYHHFSRWTKISTPAIYKKVLRLKEEGYLESTVVKGDRFADKAIYSITDKGIAYFEQLMKGCVESPVSFLFDFNVVIANLNRLDISKALSLIESLRENISAYERATQEYSLEYADIPLTGRTIFEQQLLLCRALMDWLDGFELQLREENDI